MRRSVGIMMVCAALGACASSGSLSTLSSVGTPPEPDKTAKKDAPDQPSQASSGSGLSGIWSNFSSVFNSGAQPVSQKTDAPAASLDTNEALRLINEFRAKKGLQPLSLDPQATAAAAILVKDMAQHDHMSHIGPDGQDVGKRLLASGYSYKLAAENVGVGQASLQETIEGWKKSAPHSRNMLLPNAKHIGIAYVYKADTKYKTFWALVVAAP